MLQSQRNGVQKGQASLPILAPHIELLQNRRGSGLSHGRYSELQGRLLLQEKGAACLALIGDISSGLIRCQRKSDEIARCCLIGLSHFLYLCTSTCERARSPLPEAARRRYLKFCGVVVFYRDRGRPLQTTRYPRYIAICKHLQFPAQVKRAQTMRDRYIECFYFPWRFAGWSDCKNVAPGPPPTRLQYQVI